MNLQKMSIFIILLSLSIGFAKAADDRNKDGFDPYHSRSPYSYPSSTPTYHGGYGYPSNYDAQAPASEKEREFKNLEEAFYKQFHESFYISSFGSNPSIEEKIEMIKGATELKEWENIYQEKFHTYFYCHDDKALPAQKIDMIKEELKLKEAEDAYFKKLHIDFRYSQYGIETSYSTRSTPEKIKTITEDMKFKSLLYSYLEEFQDMPSISDAGMTADTIKIKATQINALAEEREIQRLIRDLKSAHPDITDDELERQYSQLPVAENGALTRSVIIEALRAEKQRRDRR